MLNKDFREFVESPGSAGVEYLIVGGYALAAHGHPRYTGDLDIRIRATPANVDRLLQALSRFGFGSLGIENGRTSCSPTRSYNSVTRLRASISSQV